jgi:hypothetical protein
MCPFCLATAAIIAGSATGTSGLTALMAGTISRKKVHKDFSRHQDREEAKDGNDSDRSESEESRIAR